MIVLKDISLAYREKEVLRNLDLTLGEGERVALLGPSGSGKTTLLNLLAGLLRPDGGSMEGLPADGASVVFQENRLLPWLTALDNLALVAGHRPRQELAALLEELGLGGETQTHPGALSGGMARRVAIARAVAFDRPLFLLDEPFKGLDEETLGRTADFINRRTQGKTVFLITHSPREAQLLHCRTTTLGELQGENRPAATE